MDPGSAEGFKKFTFKPYHIITRWIVQITEAEFQHLAQGPTVTKCAYNQIQNMWSVPNILGYKITV